MMENDKISLFKIKLDKSNGCRATFLLNTLPKQHIISYIINHNDVFITSKEFASVYHYETCFMTWKVTTIIIYTFECNNSLAVYRIYGKCLSLENLRYPVKFVVIVRNMWYHVIVRYLTYPHIGGGNGHA